MLTDQIPIYWRQKNIQQQPLKDHVVMFEPIITYTRQAEYSSSSTQASPSSSTTFRASPRESQSEFKAYDGRTESVSPQFALYPYSPRKYVEEDKRQTDEGKRVIVGASDPAYQRFVQRDGSARDQTWYYYSDSRSQTSPQPPPASSAQPSLLSKSSVRFYYRKQFF